MKPVLGLAQLGFQTVGASFDGGPHRLTKSVFTPTYARFRELLIEAREGAGLTQAGLAKRLGRPQSYVSKFERGERRLDVVEFLEIAKALRIDAFGLLKHLTDGNIKRLPR
jgi:ribosome-binding protein aMBF1 (putative translation factor)